MHAEDSEEYEEEDMQPENEDMEAHEESQINADADALWTSVVLCMRFCGTSQQEVYVLL